jgi:ATP-dependent DNA helicase PIF1
MNITTSDLDPDQRHALELMLAGGNVFLGGRAGSGKSSILRLFRELCQRRTVFLAPTGLAALNLGGGGCTIHRFLGLPPAFLPPGYTHSPDPSRSEAILAAQTVVVDEISMVRSELFQAMADTLQALPLPGGEGRPFGGRQVIVCGDFGQLEPVSRNGLERMELTHRFGGVFPFRTLAWYMALFETAWLGYAHRQGSDRGFVDALDVVRMGHRDPMALAKALEWLNLHATFCQAPRDGTTLCTTNDSASAINMVRDAELVSPPVAFDGVVYGPFDMTSCPADSHLEIRLGSRAMLLANGISGEGTPYANGDTGLVTGIDPHLSMVQVLLDDGRLVAVGPHRWLEQEYQLVGDSETGERKLELMTVASFEQVPLKLAYAMTIHKSQGMSLSRVHVDLGRGTFASGQLYVALSRCRSLAGLSLQRPLNPCDVILDPEVLDFHECATSNGHMEEVRFPALGSPDAMLPPVI